MNTIAPPDAEQYVPIMPEDIEAYITEVGGRLDETSKALAYNVAGVLASRRVQRREDGGTIDLEMLGDAQEALFRLFEYQVALVNSGELENFYSVLSVQAAVASLLGDLDNPAITDYQQHLQSPNTELSA